MCVSPPPSSSDFHFSHFSCSPLDTQLREGEPVLEVAIGNDGRLNDKFLTALAQETSMSKVEAVEMLLEETTARLAAYPTTYAQDLEVFTATSTLFLAISQLYAAPHAPCDAPYVVTVLIGC